MIKDVYWNTGDALFEDNAPTAYAKEQETQKYKAKIGLMSASDFGYASSFGRGALSGYNLSLIHI